MRPFFALRLCSLSISLGSVALAQSAPPPPPTSAMPDMPAGSPPGAPAPAAPAPQPATEAQPPPPPPTTYPPQGQYPQPQPQYAQPQPEYAQQFPGPEAPPPSPQVERWNASQPGFVIAAERLAGIHSFHVATKTKGEPELKSSATMVNLLWGNSTQSGIAEVNGLNPYAVPYLSFHGVLSAGITVGGSLGVFSTSGSRERVTTSFDNFGNETTDVEEVDRPTGTAYVLAPRVGIILPASDMMSIWLRGGLTYYTSSLEAKAEASGGELDLRYEFKESATALSLDPMLVISPVPHVGILLGPIIDFGVAGSISERYTGADAPSDPPADVDFAVSNYGLAGGIALFL